MDAYATHLPVLLQVSEAIKRLYSQLEDIRSYRYIETGCGYYSTLLHYLFYNNPGGSLSLDTDGPWAQKINDTLGERIVDTVEVDWLEELVVKRLRENHKFNRLACLFIDHMPTYSRGNLLKKVLELCQELQQDQNSWYKLPIIVCHDSSDTQYGWNDELFNQFPIRYTYTALYPHTTVLTFNNFITRDFPSSFAKYRVQ